MTDIEHLIRINIELEGLLKVLAERDSVHARSMLAEKIEDYYTRIKAYLADGAVSASETRAMAEEGAALAAAATHVEVKDQEAVEAEGEDETDAATDAIEREETETYDAPETAEVKDQEAAEPEVEDETDAATDAIEREETETATYNDRLVKAFTLNDKFRFRRELFNGDADDFDQTLSLLAQMPSYAEAEDYLYNDLMWDARRQDVADFMAILKENMHP